MEWGDSFRRRERQRWGIKTYPDMCVYVRNELSLWVLWAGWSRLFYGLGPISTCIYFGNRNYGCKSWVRFYDSCPWNRAPGSRLALQSVVPGMSCPPIRGIITSTTRDRVSSQLVLTGSWTPTGRAEELLYFFFFSLFFLVGHIAESYSDFIRIVFLPSRTKSYRLTGLAIWACQFASLSIMYGLPTVFAKRTRTLVCFERGYPRCNQSTLDGCKVSRQSQA